jgi:hypothetical protein
MCEPPELPTVECSTTPDDPSCSTLPPVDCKANPDDPSCKVDYTTNAVQ